MTEKEPQKNSSNNPIWEWWKGEGDWLGKKKGAEKKTSGEGDPIWEWWRGKGTWLGKESTKGFSFLTNGNIGGAIGLALAGLLLANSVKWGERWKDYGKKEFYSWKGLKGKGSKMRKAFAGMGKG